MRGTRGGAPDLVSGRGSMCDIASAITELSPSLLLSAKDASPPSGRAIPSLPAGAVPCPETPGPRTAAHCPSEMLFVPGSCTGVAASVALVCDNHPAAPAACMRRSAPGTRPVTGIAEEVPPGTTSSRSPTRPPVSRAWSGRRAAVLCCSSDLSVCSGLGGAYAVPGHRAHGPCRGIWAMCS